MNAPEGQGASVLVAWRTKLLHGWDNINLTPGH